MTDTASETQTTKTPPHTLPEALGAGRIAGLLADHAGTPVTRDDIEQLVADAHLTACDSYKGWPLYATADALALDFELVQKTVTDRVAWEEASLPRDEAASRIGWHWRDISRMGREGRVTTGPGGRFLIADLDKLPAEADGEQYITAQQAAEVLEIRHPADWRYVEAAGWVAPAETYEQPVGRTRTVTVSLYRLADVREVRELPGVDWEMARGLPKGAPSPLREYARSAPTRAATLKAFAQGLAGRHGVTVWAWCSPYSGSWELDWDHPDGAPSKEQVAGELAADPAAGPYAQEVTLGTVWGRITREARRLLEPGAALVLDSVIQAESCLTCGSNLSAVRHRFTQKVHQVREHQSSSARRGPPNRGAFVLLRD